MANIYLVKKGIEVLAALTSKQKAIDCIRLFSTNYYTNKVGLDKIKIGNPDFLFEEKPWFILIDRKGKVCDWRKPDKKYILIDRWKDCYCPEGKRVIAWVLVYAVTVNEAITKAVTKLEPVIAAKKWPRYAKYFRSRNIEYPPPPENARLYHLEEL